MPRSKKLFKITGSKQGKQFAEIVNLSYHAEVFEYFGWDRFARWDGDAWAFFEGGAINGKETVQMIITDTGKYQDDENMKEYRVHICNGFDKPIEFYMHWVSTLGYSTFKTFYFSGDYPLEYEISLNWTGDKPSPKAAACQVFERMINTAFDLATEVVNKSLLHSRA